MELLLLAPGALALGALLAGPVLAHLSRRRPTRRVPFGAMMLLQRVQKRLRRRRRLRDRVLLALRLLALLLVVLAVARPELRQPGNTAADEVAGPLVVVLDDSLSMDLRARASGDDTLFSDARAAAAELVRTQPEGTRVGAVTVGGRAERLTPELTRDRTGVVAALERVEQGQGTTDLSGALREARRMLDGKGGRVVVFSDEAGPVAVPGAEDELALFGEQGVALERQLLRAEQVANLRIVEARYGEGLEGGSVRVRLVNHGDAAVEVPVVVRLPDGAEITAFAEVPAQGEAEEVVTVPRVAAGGVATATVEDPALDADDTFAFHLPRVGASRVLVVDGDPGPTPTASEVYFLERALAPWGAAGTARGGVLPEITSPAGLDRLDPEVHRVVFLANVSDPAPLATRLTDFVRRGGGLVLSLGDNVTAERWNGPLAGLLPAPLRRPRALAAFGEPGEATELPDTRLELFRPFARGGRAAFAKARWQQLFTLEPFEDDAPETQGGRRTLLRTQSGVPLLVERQVGQGRVLLLAGTIDLGWGTFPLQAAYMPFVQRVVSYLGGEAGSGGERLDALVAESVAVDLPGGVFDVTVTGPGGPVPSPVRDGRVRFVPDRAGAYVVEAPGAPPLAWVAVNTDPIESDVRPGPSLVETAARIDPERFQRKTPLAPWLLLGGVVLALASALLALFLGRRPEDPTIAEDDAAEEASHAA